MRVVEGRAPDSVAAAAGAAQEVVVSRSLARRIRADGHVVGMRVHEPARGGVTQSFTVVGVVDDIRMPGRRSSTDAVDMYRPIVPIFSFATVLLRTTLPARDAVASIRRVVADFDPTIRRAAPPGMPFGALLRTATIGEVYLRESLAPTRFAMALLLAFASIAVVLSAIGLYGVIAYSVSQRTREIGVRMAMGADARSVRQLIVGDGLRLPALGVMLGLLAAIGATRALAGLLYGVNPVDPASFIAIVVLVVGIAAVASYMPARRAMRIDPTEALRTE